MPQPTGNTMTFTITPAGCLTEHPLPLRVLTGAGQGRFNQIVLKGDPGNQAAVTLTFNVDEAEALFNPVPPVTVTLSPGAQVVLHIRTDLGLTPRGTFVDDDPTFARTIAFVSTHPDKCGSGDVNDVVVEAGS
jgi:hypothetical protein